MQPFPPIPGDVLGMQGAPQGNQYGLGGPQDTAALLAYLQANAGTLGQAVGPPPVPQVTPAPGLRIGPLSINGSGLDSAAMGILGALQNAPRPRGFGSGLVTGLARGLATGRANSMEQRQAADVKANQSAEDEYKARRTAAASLLATYRGEQLKAAREAQAAGMKPPPTGMVHITADPKDPQRVAAKAAGMALPPGEYDLPATALKRDMPLPGQGAGSSNSYFWGTVQGRGGIVPYGVLRNLKGDDMAAFTQGARDASGGAGGMVGNAANISALRGALSNIQRTKAGFDAMDVLLDKSSNLLKQQIAKVPDTGTQFGNSLARYWNAQAGRTGATNFRAVLQPVQTEATRVITSGTLNGQPITDAARSDLQAILGPNFTKKQLIDALDLLAQERGFRREGFAQTISSLKVQLGLPADTTAGPKGNDVFEQHRK